MTHSEAKNPTRPHARSHPVRTVRILRPLASTPTHRGADGAAVCIPLWDRRVASKKWRCSAGRPGRIQSSIPRKIHHQVPAIRFHVLPVEIADPRRGVSARSAHSRQGIVSATSETWRGSWRVIDQLPPNGRSPRSSRRSVRRCFGAAFRPDVVEREAYMLDTHFAPRFQT